ncbi:MAG: hypothetical protein A3C35_04030 [Omnitrophica bacterium RIFCSPHIGHO2_02_FULL_46_11]|nr:MAG: hypothetical protein A3C35_04030 [Omnitrophica bacterium RIFCSPHIGHO2_02_FULL_46_11]OGW86409.1 MAG: hypothetical protein A3A81_02310 [Omnitrophica bacterium RIFCSPLOWO2_01_FULL_45_10b]
MRFTTKTEYGLVCLIYIARHQSADLVTIKEIVKKERFSATYIEKILQKLRAANIVVSHQGSAGGYALARDPSQITMKEIIEALEGQTFDIFCEPTNRKEIVCTHFSLCGLKPIWGRTKDLLDQFYDSVTLEMIAKQENEVKSILAASERV